MVEYKISIDREFAYLPNDEGIHSEKETYTKSYVYETNNEVLNTTYNIFYNFGGYKYKVTLCGNACKKKSNNEFEIVYTIGTESFKIIIIKNDNDILTTDIYLFFFNKEIEKFICINDAIEKSFENVWIY